MNDAERTTVFVVDDDESVRKALQRLLSSLGYAVETYASPSDYLDRDAYEGIGCILLDLQMPDMSGTELQRQLLERESQVPIVFLTAHGDVPTSVGAMKLGAVDFLTKPVDEHALVDAIERSLEQHRGWLAAQRSRSENEARLDSLTERERQVMVYVIAGALNKQIADRLDISEKTVKAHRGQVMRKTGAGSVAELVRLCEQADIRPAEM